MPRGGSTTFPLHCRRERTRVSNSLSVSHDASITPSDVLEGRVAARHAQSAAALGSVFESVIPVGRLAGACTVLAGHEALALATGEARAAFSSEEGWARLLGTRFGRAVINADEPQHAHDRRRWAGASARAACPFTSGDRHTDCAPTRTVGGCPRLRRLFCCPRAHVRCSRDYAGRLC